MIVHKKEKAITLRKKGYTYQEIIKEVHVAKSTLSGWVKNEMNRNEETEIKKLTAKKGLQKKIIFNKLGSKKIIEKELASQLQYSKKINKITKKELFWLGLGLYMAEGAKTGRWKSIFYNSDPILNKIMMKFYREICHVSNKKIHVQMLLHKNISENETKNYWSNILNLPAKNFNRASFVLSKTSKGKRPKLSLPYGTIQIAVGDKRVVNKIKGWSIGLSKLFS